MYIYKDIFGIYLVAIIVLSYLWSLKYSLFGRFFLFFLIYGNKFWNCIHAYLCKNANAYELSCEGNNYLTFHSHTFYNLQQIRTHFMYMYEKLFF